MTTWKRPRHWYIALLAVAVLLVGVVFRQHSVSRTRTVLEASPNRSSKARSLSAYLISSEGFYTARTLRYDVCNGFANQRIAIAYGVVMAHALGRAAVLPEILLNGTQASDDWTLGSPNSTLPLSIMYDSQVHFNRPSLPILLSITVS